MREICQSGSEGGVALSCHPYPYQTLARLRNGPQNRKSKRCYSRSRFSITLRQDYEKR